MMLSNFLIQVNYLSSMLEKTWFWIEKELLQCKEITGVSKWNQKERSPLGCFLLRAVYHFAGGCKWHETSLFFLRNW